MTLNRKGEGTDSMDGNIKNPNTIGSDSYSTAYTSIWNEVFMRFRKNKVAVAGLFVFVIICVSCLFAPILTKWSYSYISFDSVLSKPNSVHILGTDSLGRDLFSRILYGGRITLRIALGSTGIAAIIGSVIGIQAGYFGESYDFCISGFMDIIASIPVFLLVIVFEAALGWGKGNFMYAMAIAAIPQFARLVRASVISIMGCEYIEAARALGIGHVFIIYRHVLKNIAPQLLIRLTTGAIDALLLCTIMGYLGIGISPPKPEWGYLAFSGKAQIRNHPYLVIFPCLTIALCVVSLSFFSDGLRDSLDPRE